MCVKSHSFAVSSFPAIPFRFHPTCNHPNPFHSLFVFLYLPVLAGTLLLVRLLSYWRRFLLLTQEAGQRAAVDLFLLSCPPPVSPLSSSLIRPPPAAGPLHTPSCPNRIVLAPFRNEKSCSSWLLAQLIVCTGSIYVKRSKPGPPSPKLVTQGQRNQERSLEASSPGAVRPDLWTSITPKSFQLSFTLQRLEDF